MNKEKGWWGEAESHGNTTESAIRDTGEIVFHGFDSVQLEL